MIFFWGIMNFSEGNVGGQRLVVFFFLIGGFDTDSVLCLSDSLTRRSDYLMAFSRLISSLVGDY